MSSRRRLLSVLGSAAIVGLAGCSGSNSGGSGSVDCHSHALSHGNGSVLDTGVFGTIEGNDVRLSVPLSVAAVRTHGIDTVTVYDEAGTLKHTIPVSADDADLIANKTGVGDGQLHYEQNLGRRPFHGRYRVVAVDTNGATVDSIIIGFNCFLDVSDE